MPLPEEEGPPMLFKSNIDDALAILGYGRWQIPFFVLSFLVHFLIPAQVLGSPLLSVPLPFRCFSSQTTPLEATIYVNTTNTTIQQPLTVTYESRCGATEQNISLPPPPLLLKTDMPSCSFIEYDHSTFPSTVISEFNLVCERSPLRPLFQMLISLGALCGALFGGVINDKYGRKTILVVGCVLYAVTIVVISMCPWYLGVLLCRFVVGLSISFMVLPSFSLAQETTPPRFRSHIGMLIGLGFSVGVVAFAGMALLVRPWRYLMLTASSTILVIIPLACWVEESPRWLAQKGRHMEAVDIFKRAARRNRISITSELITIFENLKVEKSKCNVVIEEDKKVIPRLGLRQCLGQCRNYLRYPGLRRILLVTPFIWYLQSLLYLGIVLNANNFTSNEPFVYLVISGIMDFTAIALITPVTIHVGRRFLSGMLFFISGILLLLDIAVPAELKWLKWLFVMTAFLLSSASYQVQFIYTPELFPTVIRASGFGLVNGIGSLGWITAPLVTDLLVQKVWWAVNAVCGLAGLLASLLIIFLPETRNLPLPETLQDVEIRLLGSKGKKDSGVVEEQFIHDATTP